jgi:hypothetical protein
MVQAAAFLRLNVARRIREWEIVKAKRDLLARRRHSESQKVLDVF